MRQPALLSSALLLRTNFSSLRRRSVRRRLRLEAGAEARVLSAAGRRCHGAMRRRPPGVVFDRGRRTVAPAERLPDDARRRPWNASPAWTQGRFRDATGPRLIRRGSHALLWRYGL